MLCANGGLPVLERSCVEADAVAAAALEDDASDDVLVSALLKALDDEETVDEEELEDASEFVLLALEPLGAFVADDEPPVDGEAAGEADGAEDAGHAVIGLVSAGFGALEG